MRISTIVFLCCTFLLSGCSFLKNYFCNNDEENECRGRRSLTTTELRSIASRHEMLLKNYFTYGSNGKVNEYGGGDDVSTLISKTMAIAASFREKGLYAEANRFDSYVDVLMYGNRTIEESIRDVENLVKSRGVMHNKKRNCQCPTGPCAKCLDSILP